LKRTIFIGWDRREEQAFKVAFRSAHMTLRESIPVHALVLADLELRVLYRRPTEHRVDGHSSILWDVISDAPMATQHACARFLAPYLARDGWVLFMDGDVLVRSDLNELFEGLDPAKAVYCVHHHHEPPEGAKMDGQMQLRYARKNWSSVMAINASHPANAALTLEMVNTVPGRDLHRFCWLPDALIGALDQAWNWLAGHSDPATDPKIVHFTEGTPDMPGYENAPYADEWRAHLERLAA